MSDDVEEAARKASRWFDDFLEWVWERGALGKLALLLWIVMILAPPIFNGYAIYVLWFQLYPTATNLTERLAVFGVLIALANGEALWVQYILFQSMFNAYIGRRRRRSRPAQIKLT